MGWGIISALESENSSQISGCTFNFDDIGSLAAILD